MVSLESWIIMLKNSLPFWSDFFLIVMNIFLLVFFVLMASIFGLHRDKLRRKYRK